MNALHALAAKGVAKLRREPVAVWGVVLAAILALLPKAGVSAEEVSLIGTGAALLGIPAVRGLVTPMQALKALLAEKAPVTFTATTSSGVAHAVTVLVNGKPVPAGSYGLTSIVEGKALGRHVRHDPRSRDYPAPMTARVRNVRWKRRSPILDQGEVGSCTGNAAAGWVATDNALREGRGDVTEATALDLYSKATHCDRIGGVYPPSDTGSSGLAAAKALKALGYSSGTYRHAFGLQHTLSALQVGPVLVGISWRTGCDTPDASGLVSYTGDVRGGHEVLADEVDTDRKVIGFSNSWGPGWGAAGRFYMTWDDFAVALADQGDVTVPT